MKICVDGEYRDMTEAEFQSLSTYEEWLKDGEVTLEKRVENIEACIEEISEEIEKLKVMTR